MFHADYGLNWDALSGCDAVTYGVANYERDNWHTGVLVYGSYCHEDGDADEAY
jgi:hypothetical protein